MLRIARRNNGTFAPTPVDRRFWNKVKKTDGCWEWLGGVTDSKRPYGKFKFGDKQTSAHRTAYELVKGPIYKGLEIDHLCKNTLCVNPDHLEAVTKQVNMFRARKDFRRRGHPRLGVNLYTAPSGGRACRQCRRFLIDKRAKEKLC